MGSEMRSEIDAVAFDIDGTLYPESMMYLCSIPSFFRDPVLMCYFGRMRNSVRSVTEMVPNSEGPASSRERFHMIQAELVLTYMHRAITAEQSRKMAERIDRHIYGVWNKSFARIRPFEGVRKLFSELADSPMKVALLSDFPPGVKPGALGIRQSCDVILCAEDAGMLKPDVRPFRLLQESLHIEDPQRILYVGNSYHKDIEGAKAAGMKTAYFSRKQLNPEDHPAADVIFHRYEEFLSKVLPQV